MLDLHTNYPFVFHKDQYLPNCLVKLSPGNVWKYLCMDKCPSSEVEFTENHTALHPSQETSLPRPRHRQHSHFPTHKAKNLGTTLDNGLSYASHILSTLSENNVPLGVQQFIWGSTFKRTSYSPYSLLKGLQQYLNGTYYYCTNSY